MLLQCSHCGKKWKHVKKIYNDKIGVHWVCDGGVGCGWKNKFPKRKKIKNK